MTDSGLDVYEEHKKFDPEKYDTYVTMQNRIDLQKYEIDCLKEKLETATSLEMEYRDRLICAILSCGSINLESFLDHPEEACKNTFDIVDNIIKYRKRRYE